jgi:hypothetical protein
LTSSNGIVCALGEGSSLKLLIFYAAVLIGRVCPYLRKRSEATIEPDAAALDVIAFFSDTPPKTAKGALRLAQALNKTGQKAGCNYSGPMGLEQF